MILKKYLDWRVVVIRNRKYQYFFILRLKLMIDMHRTTTDARASLAGGGNDGSLIGVKVCVVGTD